MTKRILVSSTILLAGFLAPVSPLAVGQGGGHASGGFRAAKAEHFEARQAIESRGLAKHEGDTLRDRHDFVLGRVGHLFSHGLSRTARVFHHPPGWGRGRKTGWHGADEPPGLEKKERSRFAFFRHPFASRRTSPFSGNDAIKRREANFDRFLGMSPDLEKSFNQNPSLINNQPFLIAHPSLNEWLKSHPQTAEELRENPRVFASPERHFHATEARFQGGEFDINRREVAAFDRFLDANPSIATSLSQNPSLINNSTFLAQNPALSTWLKAHPQVAAELSENPQAFFNSEQRFEGTKGEQVEGSGGL